MSLCDSSNNIFGAKGRIATEENFAISRLEGVFIELGQPPIIEFNICFTLDQGKAFS